MYSTSAHGSVFIGAPCLLACVKVHDQNNCHTGTTATQQPRCSTASRAPSPAGFVILKLASEYKDAFSCRTMKPTTMKLCCVVVGKPGAFIIQIKSDATVCELQDVIAAKQQYTGFPASELTLFLAKQSDLWLSADAAGAKALMRGEIDASADRLHNHVRMYGATTLKAAFSAANLLDAPVANQVTRDHSAAGVPVV
ncbi:hypothetical protein PybrP1_006584 [[Pythium] brassicae (nom. inval.)]|nr:hypothetical protein PybrP1_006584 [[Pythium] brassicae (nom. inval.)]